MTKCPHKTCDLHRLLTAASVGIPIFAVGGPMTESRSVLAEGLYWESSGAGDVNLPRSGNLPDEPPSSVQVEELPDGPPTFSTVELTRSPSIDQSGIRLADSVIAVSKPNAGFID